MTLRARERVAYGCPDMFFSEKMCVRYGSDLNSLQCASMLTSF